MSSVDDDLEEISEAQLIDFLGERAKVHWEKKGEPYLLSLVSPDLKSDRKTFKDAIGGGSLARWAEGTEQDQFKVVRHPVQKAKVGIIPGDKTYDYPVDDLNEIGGGHRLLAEVSIKGRSRKPVVVRFLESLSRLDEEDLAKVQIPVSVIVKLLNE